MKIVLIGAPNSGKTELAHQLAGFLPDCWVVDDYIKGIEERSNIALGHYATYVGNMQAVLGRWEAERKALKDGPANLVTCGSVVESSIYEAINAYSMAQVASNSIERAQFDARTAATMTWFGTFRHDTWDYDYAFRLPLAEDHSDQWDTSIDDSLPEAAEAFDVDIHTLSTDRRVRLDEVRKIIKEKDERLQDSESAIPQGESDEAGSSEDGEASRIA